MEISEDVSITPAWVSRSGWEEGEEVNLKAEVGAGAGVGAGAVTLKARGAEALKMQNLMLHSEYFRLMFAGSERSFIRTSLIIGQDVTTVTLEEVF